MYQCTECQAPVSKPHLRCDQCIASLRQAQTEPEFDNLDTILNIRGPQDLSRMIQPASSLLYTDQTPEVVGVVPEVVHINETNLSFNTTPSSLNLSLNHQSSSDDLAEEPIFDQTSSELDHDHFEVRPNFEVRPSEQTLDVETFGDFDDFDEGLNPALTEITSLPPLKQQSESIDTSEVLELKTTPTVSQGTPSLGPAQNYSQEEYLVNHTDVNTPPFSSASPPSASPPPIPPVHTSSGIPRLTSLPLTQLTTPGSPQSSSPLASSPFASSTSQSSTHQWPQTPNPFAPSRPSVHEQISGIKVKVNSEVNVTESSSSNYHLIDLTHQIHSNSIEPNTQLSIFDSYVSWQPSDQEGFYHLQAKTMSAPSYLLQLWRPLERREEQSIDYDQYYRCGDCCFLIKKMNWNDLLDSSERSNQSVSTDIYDSHTQIPEYHPDGTPGAQEKFKEASFKPKTSSLSELHSSEAKEEEQSLMLLIYQDVTHQKLASRSTRSIPLQRLGERLLKPLGAFPLALSSSIRVGSGGQCEISLPLNDIKIQESVAFVLRTTESSEKLTISGSSTIWRALNTQEQIPYGGVIALDRHLLSIISL